MLRAETEEYIRMGMRMLNKKHLEKAILFSLLLTNVCRLGGATEYETCITGSENGYNSIKSIVGETTRYEFADGDAIGVPADIASNAKTAFSAVTADGANKKIEINSTGNLSLTGKGAPVAAMSKKNIDVGAVNGAVLTILGEKVTITDIGTDRKSETSFLAGARDSGSIIFDNVVTEIDVGNSEINHVGIFAGNGAVTFTENTGILNIGSGTGIYVADNGSFTFNNTQGSLNVTNQGTGIYMQGGSVSIKGSETVIKAVSDDGLKGNSAVSVSIEKNNDNNTLDFGAEKTLLHGKTAGLYISDGGRFSDGDSDMNSYTGDTMVNFAGDTVITAVGGEYGSDAVYSDVGAKINFDKQVVLKASTAEDGSSAHGAEILYGSVLTAKDGLTVAVSTTGKTDAYSYPADAVGLKTLGAGSKIDVTGATLITAKTNSGIATGVRNWNDGELGLKGAFAADVSSKSGEAIGLYNYDSTSNVADTFRARVSSESGAATGILNWASKDAVFKGDAIITASSTNGDVKGIYNRNNAKATFEEALNITAASVSGKSTGILGWQGGSLSVNGSAVIDVDSQAGATGVWVDTAGSSIDFRGKSLIKVNNSIVDVKNRAAVYNYGVIAANTGKVTFADDTVIDLSGAAKNTLTKGVYAYGAAAVDFARGLVLDNQDGSDHSLYANNDGSIIRVNSSGEGNVYLTGSIRAENAGLVNIQLNNAASYYKGATTEASNGKIELELQKSARWDVTGNSSLTRLDFGSDAVIDMRQQPGSQILKTEALSGNDGTFVLGVDLEKGTADRIQIGNGAENTKGAYNLKVQDVNWRTGDGLHLELVADASDTGHIFTVQDLYNGGIYNYKSEVSKEDGSTTKWYLESIKTERTEDAASLLQTADSLYSSWMLGSDNLQGRLGELRQTGSQRGLWARVNRSKLRGAAFKNNYQTYQIGYDAAFKDVDGNSVNDWIGGVAFEYVKGSIGYGIGSGENKTAALLLYCTKHSQAGDKVDIVLKHGQLKGDFDTFGMAADSGNYKNRASLLSVEYGKRLVLQNGSYLEPQAQLTLGHINSGSYVTDRNISVTTAGIDSAVGRLGIELGKRYNGGSAWFKVSALHEFDGSTKTSLHIAEESLVEEQNYGGTWCELALGGNVQLAENNNLYFDVTRSFGGDFQKQWQVNAGLRWSF